MFKKNNAEIKCILEKCELSYQDHQKLKAHSNKMDIKFFSTVFDLKSLNLLEDLEVELYKIASFDIGNTVLLKEVAKTKKPVICLTGACLIKNNFDGLINLQQELL